MGVETPTSEYKDHKGRWDRCRDAVEGSDAIKEKTTTYLPMIGDPNDSNCTEKYKAYLKRALWFGLTARVVEGLVGAIFRKKPIINIPESKMEFLHSMTPDGESLEEFAQIVTEEVIITGRYGVLVDMPSEEGVQVAYLAGYKTEAIINLRYNRAGGTDKLSLVVLKESVRRVDAEDPFRVKKEDQYRVLSLDENMKYKVQVYVKNDSEFVEDLDQTVNPTLRGEYLDFIPFVPIGPSPKKRGIQKSPIQDVVDANISLFCTSADLENGRHWCGCPTLWGAGIDDESDDETKIMVGSPVAHLFANPEASLQLLELSEGLQPLEKAIEEKKDLIIALGGRLLEAQKRQVEAADTHKERKQGENSVLATIANSISSSLTKLLRWWAEWSTVPEYEKVSISLNTDFVADQFAATNLKELREALKNGDISFATYFYNMKRAEMYPDEWTENDEKESIDADGGGLKDASL